jgi:microcystin-dependent protein
MFVLPDLRGKTIIGPSTNYALGSSGGNSNTTLSVNNLPSHTHTGTTDSDGSHTHTASDSGHSHTYSDAYYSENGGPVNGPNGQNNNIGTSSSTDYDNNLYTRTVTTSSANANITVQSSGSHTHTFTTNSTGSGSEFSNMQPYTAINYIIKYI